ncbi:MAG: hypothetical protein E7282_05130 [Lachnospiraceae bacterium]|nr:hypothetical protein [Lachnospiraceae bacterium]
MDRKKSFKIVIRITCIVIEILLVWGIILAIRGVELSGLPKPDELEKIEIIDSSRSDIIVTLESIDDIEKIYEWSGLLRHRIFQTNHSIQDEHFRINYYLKDGTSESLYVDDNIVSFRQKKYSLIDSKLFVQIIESEYFDTP